MSVAPGNFVETRKPIYVDGCWHVLLCYTPHQDVVDDDLDARMASQANLLWCFHGTSLTIAHKVFEEGGLLAGEATHLNDTGVFIIGRTEEEPYSLGPNFVLARNRAKCNRCSEWTTFQAPSAWSMPVVIMFPHPLRDLTRLKDYKDYCSSKYVINRPVGCYVKLPQEGARLLLCYQDYLAWVRLHAVPHCNVPRGILKNDDFEDLMMCGGRLNDPFHWSTRQSNPHASCGSICRVRDLESAGWVSSKNVPEERRIYRCRACAHALSFSLASRNVLF